ncbi:MAG: zinc ribbon domain-containing protein [Bacteroides sp.]|nr:zinc ribbon domain-containing protein [Eubacterium sp.]MCM1419560.1 zinc ribbon domain-containing protein [Roseburia sp.]MCM1462425.1 zinc ribbon domain-containing protein [Bacteroides sp.]
MKTCKLCGAENRDDSRFCSTCGGAEFILGQPTIPPPPPPPSAMSAPLPPTPKPEFTRYDLSTIFGFVAALVGLFQISLILEPLALVTAILGFARGKRYRGLAVAGVVIAGIGLILRFFTALYTNGLIPRWIITGTFD